MIALLNMSAKTKMEIKKALPISELWKKPRVPSPAKPQKVNAKLKKKKRSASPKPAPTTDRDVAVASTVKSVIKPEVKEAKSKDVPLTLLDKEVSRSTVSIPCSQFSSNCMSIESTLLLHRLIHL